MATMTSRSRRPGSRAQNIQTCSPWILQCTVLPVGRVTAATCAGGQEAFASSAVAAQAPIAPVTGCSACIFIHRRDAPECALLPRRVMSENQSREEPGRRGAGHGRPGQLPHQARLISASRRGVRAVRSGWRSRATESSDRVPAPRAAAWPRRRRRTSGRGYPSRRRGRRLRCAHRGTAATGPPDARGQRQQRRAVVLPRAAARPSASRPGSGRSPRQHGHVWRSMTTATARPLSAGRHPVPDAPPRTRRAAQPGFRPGRRHGPPLPSTDRPQAADSNILANIALETGSTDFVDAQPDTLNA